MAEPRFDPGGFYQFNLADGAVCTRGGDRVLVLSDTVVAPLVSAAVRNGDLTAVRELGRSVGDHARASLGGEPSSFSPETVLGHAAAVLGLFGFGRLAFERWNDALVATVTGGPPLDTEQLAVAALLGGMLSSLSGAEVACVPVDEGTFVVVAPPIAEQVWSWSKEGASLGAIVGRLQPGASA